MKKLLGTSPLTTIGGIAAAIGAAVFGAKETGLIEQIPEVVAWIGIFAAAIGVGLIGFSARDNRVTSKKAGAE